MAIIKGTKDNLADKFDMEWLKHKLGSRVIMYKNIKDFDHSSFAVGKKTKWITDVI